MVKERVIEGVLFDIGGVLLDFDHMKSCNKLAPLCNLTANEVYRRVFGSGLEREFDLGLPPALFYTGALGLLGITANDISFNEFALVWGAIFEERTVVTNIVKALNGRARLFLLSNTNSLHYTYIKEHFRYFNNCFEKSFLSFELKGRKPDPAVFATVIEATSISPASMLYIDDLPENVEAAKELGINAVLYTSVEALKESLQSVGL